MTVRALQEHRDELEADLQEFFHLDLEEFKKHGRLSLHKIYVCVKSLMRKPGRSTLLMALDEATEWDAKEYILARLSDGMELANYLFIQANSGESSEEMPLPTPIRRPGEPDPETQKPKPEEFASGKEVAEFFGRMSSL
ncbi:hypothetical protein [Streptomyces mutomycini]|uniref:hypothetical protein n=1 Tax=Streptomyces mutomycini TaxID=284036 RepID=UPI00340CF013